MIGKMDCFGLTDMGKVREANEDQFLISDLVKSMLIHQTSLSHEDHTRLFGNSQGQLLLVADGMGGHAAGQHASSIAVQSLARYVLNTMPWFFRLQESQENDLDEELIAALEAASEASKLLSRAAPSVGGWEPRSRWPTSSGQGCMSSTSATAVATSFVNRGWNKLLLTIRWPSRWWSRAHCLPDKPKNPAGATSYGTA